MRGKRVTFKFNAPENVQTVKLCGNFTDWEQGAIVMEKSGVGEWWAQVSLETGDYEYKFWVDGIWHNDPAADKQVANVWGSENSLRVVR
jgi:1,4-alpha-glucan branching enzyme